jgi:multidrug resistance efflux pump
MKAFLSGRRLVHVGLGLLLVLGVLVGCFLTRGREALADRSDATPPEPEADAISVTTVTPRLDKNFQMTVERPADVEAYYRADIEARVAGEVRSIRVAPGSAVEKDQPLVQIYVPDLWADEREKGHLVKQRERELELTQEKAEAARIAVKTAQANVAEKKTLLDKAKADTVYLTYKFNRLQALWESRSIDQNVRDEAEKDLAVARASEVAADAARIKAEAELDDARANVKVMEAEVKRIAALIDVAKSDHEKAQALVEYALVKAPFPGTVVSRHVDPGSFVQNASTGHPTAVLTLERTDIVTVVMRVPDSYASFVTPGTEAILELDTLPGVKIRGKVTRFARSLVTTARDRTMRVEVDLWNGDPAAYKAFFADKKNLADLKDGPLPLVPEFTGKTQQGQQRIPLMADMYGNMTLVLKKFGDVKLIPSQAVIRQGGRTMIYVVEDGKAHLMSVAEQMDDGDLAQVVRLGDRGEILGPLTGTEEVIVTNQEELTEGQAVTTTPMPDWKALKSKKAPH